MRRRYSLIFLWLFFAAFAAYALAVTAYRHGFVRSESIDLISVILIPAIFISFLLGVASTFISLNIRLYEDDPAIMTELRINPLKYLLWREVREKLLLQHERKMRERSAPHSGSD